MPRTLLVSGASSGIGRAIAKRLLERGETVIGVARDFTKSPVECPRFHPIQLDLAHLDALPGALAALAARFPGLDGLICCAGAGRFGSLEEFSYAQIRELIDLNLTSQLFLARAFLPGMKRRGRGDLIFMGSEAALAGGRRGAVYSATKFALRGLAQSLRQECAGAGVRVSIVNPGMAQTDFFTGLEFAPGEGEDQHLEPEDVADAVVQVLDVRRGAVIDELNLTPCKRVLRFKRKGD
jgi:3-hydroxy acid dehydrogenase/malonic semialdehyde reductase